MQGELNACPLYNMCSVDVLGIPYALHQAGFGLGIILIAVVALFTGKCVTVHHVTRYVVRSVIRCVTQ